MDSQIQILFRHQNGITELVHITNDIGEAEDFVSMKNNELAAHGFLGCWFTSGDN